MFQWEKDGIPQRETHWPNVVFSMELHGNAMYSNGKGGQYSMDTIYMEFHGNQ